jgi:hypothetical protein
MMAPFLTACIRSCGYVLTAVVIRPVTIYELTHAIRARIVPGMHEHALGRPNLEIGHPEHYTKASLLFEALALTAMIVLVRQIMIEASPIIPEDPQRLDSLIGSLDPMPNAMGRRCSNIIKPKVHLGLHGLHPR